MNSVESLVTEAITLLERALDLCPESYDTHFSLGLSYAMNDKDPVRAAYHFAKALTYAPYKKPAESALVNAFMRPDNYAQTIEVFSNLLAHEDNPGLLYYNLSNSLFQAGMISEAKDSIEKAIAADPKHLASWSRLGIVCLSLHSDRAAITAFETVLSFTPQSDKDRELIENARELLATLLEDQKL